MISQIKTLYKESFILGSGFVVDFLHSVMISPVAGLNGVRLSKRDCTRSYYQPPPPSDIERIKRNMVKQQKARALIMEILGKIKK